MYQFSDQIVISKGNTKIGNTPNVSLPPIVSCQKDIPCAKEGCYSLKAMRRFACVRAAREHNWDVLSKDHNRFFRDIEAYIIEKRPDRFRWHVDGDIPSQHYLDSMQEIARRLPAIRMLAFTKNYSLDLSNLPQNLVIIPSMWIEFGRPETFKDRPIAWLYDPRKPDCRIMGNYFTCVGKCTGCWKCWNISILEKDVVFYRH